MNDPRLYSLDLGLQVSLPMNIIHTDMAPSPDIEESVRKSALKVEGIRGLQRCFVRKMGLYYCVDLDVQVDPDLSVQ